MGGSIQNAGKIEAAISFEMKQPVPQLVGMFEYTPLLSQRADFEIYLAAIAQNTVGASAELKAK